MTNQGKQSILQGNTALGIELGSTRMKAVLIDEHHNTLATGGYQWENQLIDGHWTYALEEVWAGLQASFADLAKNVKHTYQLELTTVGAIGISAMMHGYLAFHEEELLVPFRTWRNTTTEQAAALLTKEFSFNVPQRWSVAHLYQAILNNEEHVKNISFITTLAGYIHWQLTGEQVLGIGDASGMFPIDSLMGDYHAGMLAQFDALVAPQEYSWALKNSMPRVLLAGQDAGKLTEKGAKLLDPTGALQAGIPLCPPEGDAGTGMVATNSTVEKTGNVSAGTSVFAMVVLEHALAEVHVEIDMVTTPAGKPVAMVHCNNFTSDLDAWVRLFAETMESMGFSVATPALYDMLYNKALEGDPACGGLVSYNYYSGEPITGLEQGRPLFARLPDSDFSLANFMRNIIFSAMGTLRIGMDILTEKEGVTLSKLQGHGGFFKTELVGQRLMAAALEVPVEVMETAGEGGAWGIALLANFLRQRQQDQSLESFLQSQVFSDKKSSLESPQARDVAGFTEYMDRYQKGLAIQQAAVKHLN